MAPLVVALRCRTSDRTGGRARGVHELAPLVAARLGVETRAIGSPAEPRVGSWDDDLHGSRGCLLEAGGQVDDALTEGRPPIVVAGDCSIALTTLAPVARARPDARVLWLDAHGDFNTPTTTSSGYLAGMALAGACGAWETGVAKPFPPERVVLVGVRDLEPPERERLERSSVTVVGASLETLVYTQNALDRAPVYVASRPRRPRSGELPRRLARERRPRPGEALRPPRGGGRRERGPRARGCGLRGA